MVRERVLRSAAPPTPEDWLAALRTVDPDGTVQVLPGAAAQLLDGTGGLVATVVLPRRVDVPGESERLLGLADAGPWWSDVVAPEGEARVDALLAAIADRRGGAVD